MTLSNELGVVFIDTFWLVLGGCGSAVLAAIYCWGNPRWHYLQADI